MSDDTLFSALYALGEADRAAARLELAVKDAKERSRAARDQAAIAAQHLTAAFAEMPDANTVYTAGSHAFRWTGDRWARVETKYASSISIPVREEA